MPVDSTVLNASRRSERASNFVDFVEGFRTSCTGQALNFLVLAPHEHSEKQEPEFAKGAAHIERRLGVFELRAGAEGAISRRQTAKFVRARVESV